MLKAGLLVGTALEAGSMARAIEDAMVLYGVIDIAEETPEAAENRRKALSAIATGVVNHLLANIEIVINVNKLGGSVPAATTTLRGSAGEVK